MRPKWDSSKGRPEPIAALNRIPERANHESLVDVRLVAPKLKMGRAHVIPYVRAQVAEMIAEVTEKLPAGVYLGLIEGWRPIERQQRILLSGDPPSPSNPPSGCAFRTRCPHAIASCAEAVPQLRPFGGLKVACHRAEDIA